MLLAVAACVVGLVLLAKAADAFVLGAAQIAVALRVSPVVIGAVVIGVGTSAPELLVSALAAGQGELDIAQGNVAGSNLANLSLVLGAAAVLAPLRVASSTMRFEAPLSAAGCVLFAAVVVDGRATRVDGGILLVALVIAMVALLRRAASGRDVALAGEVEEFLHEDEPEPVPLRRDAVRAGLGLIGTIVGAQLLVEGATTIADELGLASGLVGLTLVAVGTSLPELVTAISAARHGEPDLIVGNLLGSNLFNSLAVMPAAALVGPARFDDGDLVRLSLLLMLAVVTVSLTLLRTGHVVTRKEGVALLAAYAVTVPLLAA